MGSYGAATLKYTVCLGMGDLSQLSAKARTELKRIYAHGNLLTCNPAMFDS